MRIHADPTTNGTGIALDVDHPNTLQTFGPDFIPRGVVLTPAEAAELRDELTRALARIAPKTRTPADVLTDPQPGDRVEWDDGEVWTVSLITFDAGGFSGLEFDSSTGARMPVGRYVWNDLGNAPLVPFVCVPASDVPPPAA